ncbi:MAG: VWA domain-containing protein [Actinobacteria bacterium]|nr:VWA domain-containing protein [Actinomycetota bacterium]
MEGAAAEAAEKEAGRRTKSRTELSRYPNFEQVSPEVGELDEAALDRAMRENPDDTLSMVADLTAATDPKLREAAKHIAARLMLDLAGTTKRRRKGIGRIVTQPFRGDGDIDIDTSIEAFEGSGARRRVKVEELRVRSWSKRDTALCLVVDRSGSMGGKPLATSALAAAAVSLREPDDYSVLAFGREVIVAKSQDMQRPGVEVVNSLLSLRGFGTTDLAGALRAAVEQLSRSRATRKVVVLLSDCRATETGDVEAAARAVDELCIVAPEGDDAEARTLAASVGARIATVAEPTDVPVALCEVLDRN